MPRPFIRFAGILAAMALLIPAVASGATPSGKSADGGSSVTVAVQTPRMSFQDETYRAGFSITGACLDSSDDVAVTRRVCDDPASPPITEGTVRNALLGFAAYRQAEAGRQDLPWFETMQAAAPEQLERVHVELAEPGNLTVVVTGYPTADVDPEPVAGSAFPDAEIAGSSVTWQRDAAGIGTYDFSVRFAPSSASGFLGTFVPEVRIELRRASPRLLAYPLGSVPALGEAEVTSRLVMTQRVDPPSGPPDMSTAGYLPIRGSGTLPNTWETSAAMDARGSWIASAQGQVSDANEGMFAELAPGSLGVADGAFMSSFFFGPTPPKAIPWPNFSFLPDLKPASFQLSVQTTSTSYLDMQGASTIWDGDAMEFGYVTGLHTLAAGSATGTPKDSDGTLGPDWDGGIARTWSGTWVNSIPDGEPNALNASAEGPRNLTGIAFQHTATIPMVITGGDIDNRSGSAPVEGNPATMSVPLGQCPIAVVRVELWIPNTNYGSNVSSLSGCPGLISVTPLVGAGGYWLKSSKDGYDRHWSNLTALQIFTTDSTRLPIVDSDALVGQEAVVVPKGAAGAVTVDDAITGVSRRIDLSPGVWQVTVSGGDRLSATRLN